MKTAHLVVLMATIILIGLGASFLIAMSSNDGCLPWETSQAKNRWQESVKVCR